MLTRPGQQVQVFRSFSFGVTVALLTALAEVGRTSSECRTITNVAYRMYSPGEVITLGPCPCSCKDYVWEKKRTDTIPRSFHHQRKLQLTVAAEVGAMYCCKCRTQGYPHQRCQQYRRSCCYGVAVQPRVDFRIKQLGKQTTTVRTNVSVQLYCNVTGYPFPRMRRHGPVDVFQAKSERKFNDTNPYYAQSPWYSVYKVDVPPEMVTRNFSGNYSCTGEVNVFQDGITNESTVVLAVTAYADPGVVVHCQEPTKEGNLTVMCTVDSPEPYTVAWLRGGVNISEANEKYYTFHNLSDYFLVVTAASQKDRREKYTCVVTTDFSQTKREFQCPLDSFGTGLPGHHEPANPVSIPGLVIFGLIATLAVAAIAIVVYKCKRRESPRRSDDDQIVSLSTKELGQGDLRRRTHS